MADTQHRRLAKALMDRYGSTYAHQAGVRVRDNTPAPLFQLLYGSLLFSAPVPAQSALRAWIALREAGFRTAPQMADASWQARVDAITDEGYKRYDEKTATQLGELATRTLELYRGDLRELREAAQRRPAEERARLMEFNGIGEVGADIFLREAQRVWTELYPYADDKVLVAAGKLGLPQDPQALAELVSPGRFTAFVTSLVQTELDDTYQEVREAA